MNRLRILTLLAAALPSIVAAQGTTDGRRSNTKGFFASAALNITGIKVDEFGGESESGPGGTLLIGYGFTQKFSLFFEGASSNIDGASGDYGLGHFDFGARYSFSKPSMKFIPFLEAGLTGRAAGQDDVVIVDDEGTVYTGDLEMSGVGFSLGGGLHYFFNPKWALTTGLKWTMGEFSTVKFGSVSVNDLEVDATSRRFNIGISWFPK